jgi:hypothetical protein
MPMNKKKSKVIAIIIILLAITFALFNCSKYNAVAPFFDGLTLVYDVSGTKFIYKVYALEDNKYHIVHIEKWTGLGDKTYEYFTDIHGIVYKVTRKASRNYKGGFSPIWISTSEMKIGDTFNGGQKVIERKQWKKWDVLVVKNPNVDMKSYYEVNTGFYVGYEGRARGGSSAEVLINDNADIPTVE